MNTWRELFDWLNTEIPALLAGEVSLASAMPVAATEQDYRSEIDALIRGYLATGRWRFSNDIERHFLFYRLLYARTVTSGFCALGLPTPDKNNTPPLQELVLIHIWHSAGFDWYREDQERLGVVVDAVR